MNQDFSTTTTATSGRLEASITESSLGSRRRSSKGGNSSSSSSSNDKMKNNKSRNRRESGHFVGLKEEGEEPYDDIVSPKLKLIRSSSESQIVYPSPTYHMFAQYLLLGLAIVLTVHSLYFLKEHSEGFDMKTASDWESCLLVWCAGWITAAATGLGVLPFLCVTHLSPRLVAISNAIAAGMMLAASIGLIAEGSMQETSPDALFLPAIRVLAGLYLGVGFIKGSAVFLGDGDPTDLLDTEVLNMRRVLLIMGVMTIHSISEGVGIGVSYHSQTLGGFISATMAMHNVPEGIAISIVLIPRGFSLLSTTLWCIFSSLPQPVMAVPAFLFVEQFKFITPIGFGFAAGAMCYVALYELMVEAEEYLSQKSVNLVTAISMIVMGIVQIIVREGTM